MSPRRSAFFRKWFTFNVSQDRIVHAVFLLVCLVAVYLLVMSFILLSEVHNKFKPWQQPNIQPKNILPTMRFIERNLNTTTTETQSPNTSTYHSLKPVSTDLPEPLSEDAPIKVILFWNSFFTNSEYHFGLGTLPFLTYNCPVSACRTTTNKSEVGIADAVVFHTPEVGPLPDIRPPNQKYALVQREPHYPKSKQLLNDYYDMFNLTMTYRYDSDIPIPYGKVVDRTNQSVYYNQYPPDSKTSQIVWVVSHCNSLGRREMYMDELKKHINIDIYGDCGNLTCEKSDTMGCLHKFETQYRFYVAFENTYCLDYVSEKLYRSLMFDMIPIVYGKVNYTAYSPSRSVIDILDFPNPKTLAEYLWYLSENPQQYSRYMDWKKSYDIVQSREEIFAPAFCRMCEILHDPEYYYRDYRNVSAWWLDGTCELGFMAKFRKNHHW